MQAKVVAPPMQPISTIRLKCQQQQQRQEYETGTNLKNLWEGPNYVILILLQLELCHHLFINEQLSRQLVSQRQKAPKVHSADEIVVLM